MRTTLVRLVRVVGQSHGRVGKIAPRADGSELHAVDGQLICIELPPVPPDGATWRCDTRHVWRVSAKTLDECGIVGYPNVFVCQHQIEID